MKSKLRWIVVGAVFIAGSFAFVSNITNKQVEYAPKKSNNQAGPIVIKAKASIDPEKGEYSIEPNVKGDLQIIENYIIFWPEEGVGFSKDTKYKATFSGYRTLSGENLKTINISFQIYNNAVYSSLQKEVLEKYGHLEGTSNPFLAKLPYTEPYTYRVTYRINDTVGNQDKSDYELLGNEKNWKEKKNNYTVVIETLVNQGRNDDINKYRQDVALARQAALAWIGEQGVDVNNDIVYAFIPDDDALTIPPSSQVEIDVD